MVLKGKQKEWEGANIFISLWKEEKGLQILQINSLTAAGNPTSERDFSVFEGGSWTQLCLEQVRGTSMVLPGILPLAF